MTEQTEALLLLLQRQQEQQTLDRQQFHEMMSVMQEQLRTLGNKTPELSTISAVEKSVDRSITNFTYAPEEGMTFDSWYKRFEDIFNVDAKNLDDAARVRFLLRKLDAKAHEKFVNLILPKEPRDLKFEEVVNTLKDIFGPNTSRFSQRYKCLKIIKNSRDDIITYTSIVNSECEKFRLGELTTEQFKCLIFVCGLQSCIDAEFRLRLLNRIESDATTKLKDLCDEYRRFDILKHDNKMIETQSDNTVNIAWVRGKQKQPSSHLKSQNKNDKPKTPCWQCGDVHYVKNCRFTDHKCAQCGNIGHKEGYCACNRRQKQETRNWQHNRERRLSHKANGVQSVRTTTDIRQRRKFITATIDGHKVRFQLDTGSDITVLSTASWKQIGAPRLKPVIVEARDVSNNIIQFAGQTIKEMETNGRLAKGTIYVGKGNNARNLLGLDFIDQLCLWNIPTVCSSIKKTIPADRSSKTFAKPVIENGILNLRQRYPEVCSKSLGRCVKAKAILQLRDDAKPIFRPKRPIPYATLEIVERELSRLEAEGIITRVDYSRWAAPIVAVKKATGTIRICADFSTGLNNALEFHNYPLPVPEDIFVTLNGGRYFSQIDLTDAYLQVEVDDTSKELLTINTHKGLYRYNRLPFGVKSAPGIFQQIMDTMLAGIKGAVAYLDDIIIMGRTKEEHDVRLDAVFQRIKEFGFHVNPDKCNFFLPRIRYLGFIFDANGRHPDPEKIEAIQQMPAPTDIKTLRSFLGLISYYGVFVKEMRDLRAPLDKLLKKEAKWNWTEDCQNVFERSKEILKSDLLLTHYDPNRPIVVAADASKNGLGAVISHRFMDGTEKAIAHASRSLTPTECNYSQIEKEALGLIFAIKKFHRMIHGRHFTLLTDHKPLLAIFGSKSGIPVHSANRLQRWAIILLGYNFDIQYRSTNTFGQVDALSRLISTHVQNDEDTVVAAINVEADTRKTLSDAIDSLPVTAHDISKLTEKDDLLQNIVRYINANWPNTIKDRYLIQFFNRRDTLSIVDGCLLTGDRVVIPKALQPKVLRQLHKGHPGITRMKGIARSYVYWPDIDKDIETTVKQCQACLYASKDPVKTILAPWPKTGKPWSRIHVDYAGPFDGYHFLVIVDSHSKWPEIFMTDRTTSFNTIKLLRQLFSQFGMPEVIVSDNGAQFTSIDFADFCTRNGISHIRSPPYHPQSNGQAERFVDTLKRALRKLKGEETTAEALQTFLLSYRTTPNSVLGNRSPAEVFLGRQLRTSMDLVRPTAPAEAWKNLEMEKDHNRRHGARERSFTRGDLVLVRDYHNQKKVWRNGVVLRRRGRVIYDVQVGADVWRRHTNQLRRRDKTHDVPKPDEVLDVLLDDFNLQSTSTSTGSPEQLLNNSDQQPVKVPTELRRSTRQRRPRVRFSPEVQSITSERWATGDPISTGDVGIASSYHQDTKSTCRHEINQHNVMSNMTCTDLIDPWRWMDI